MRAMQARLYGSELEQKHIRSLGTITEQDRVDLPKSVGINSCGAPLC